LSSARSIPRFAIVVPTITLPFTSGRFHVAPGKTKYAVAIHQFPRNARKNKRIGDPRQSNPKRRARFNNELLHCLRMQRTAVRIDIFSSGR